MKRLFGKSIRDKDEREVARGEEAKQEEQIEESSMQETTGSKKLEKSKRKGRAKWTDGEKGGGDASRVERKRELHSEQKQTVAESPNDTIDMLKEDDDDEDPYDGSNIKSITDSAGGGNVEPVQLMPLLGQRQGSSKVLQIPPALSSHSDENETNGDGDHASAVSSKKHTRKTKDIKSVGGKGAAKKQQPSTSKRKSNSDYDSPENIVPFVKKEDLPSLPRIELGKDEHFIASKYNYKKSISGFRLRARLLRYPSFSDQDMSQCNMAVLDDREFYWQEKVFSKAEVKRYQKSANCITEQEKKYHEEINQNPDSSGNLLYSYVWNDPYVVKKMQKTLTRKCPVPHVPDTRNAQRLSTDISSNGWQSSDDAMMDAASSDDSIDFDKPLSSSTPKTSRKAKVKESERSAKEEKKVRERKERELRELERKNKRIVEGILKKQQDEDKRKKQEESKAADKIKKLDAILDKENEHREEYMKKYRYSKRPSLPLGARFRSSRQKPSPKQVSKKLRSHLGTKSSELSTDQVEESSQSMESTKEENYGRTGPGESKSTSPPLPHRSEFTRKVGDAGSMEYYKSNKGSIDHMKRRKKFGDRNLYPNSQTMFIMASIPHLPGKYKEVVLCMLRNIPTQGVLVSKPALGYRNIEVKRNQIFRVSCELSKSSGFPPSDPYVQKLDNRVSGKGSTSIDCGDFASFFEIVPKNELRLTVMGEITTAEGFDATPLSIYYLVDIPKGWRNDSVTSNTEGITHTCFTNDASVAHFSHDFSFHLAFSMDSLENSNSYPVPIITLMVVSMRYPSPRILYEGYGYVNIPVTPGCHHVKIRTWKPRPRSTVEKMRAAFLDITPSLQDMKFGHVPSYGNEESGKANLVSLQTDPSGAVKLRLHVIHQTSNITKEHNGKLDFLEKMSSATIMKSVQAVIEAFQRARQKAISLKDQYE